MLEQIDLEERISRQEFARLSPELITRLGALQRQAHEAGLPVIILIEGWHGAGKGMLLNFFSQAMDARGFRIYTMDKQTDEEAAYPFLWRYWTKIPGRGQVVMFDSGWYRQSVTAAMKDKDALKSLEERCSDIIAFERMLSDGGYIILKLFLHISKQEQKERLSSMAEDDFQAWRIGNKAWKQNKRYDRYLSLYDRLLTLTDDEAAPWILISAHDRHVVKLRAGQALAKALAAALADRGPKAADTGEPAAKEDDFPWRPSGTRNEDCAEVYYHDELDKYQKRLRGLQFEAYRRGIPSIFVFEGWDAAGKGGAIHRLCHSLDPRGYRVVPVAAPNHSERGRHYLWRFWREFPAAGQMVIFDRSWYGRVLVERVEGFASRREWERAYGEIAAMEQYLVRNGVLVQKFWLDITSEEQLARFKDREQDPDKVWKITEEDWRNRARREDYETAVAVMLRRTNFAAAPWHVIDANMKRRARLEVLRLVVEAIEKRCAEK